MRVVVYSEEDYEPMTVIDVCIDDLKRLHPSGDYLRFIPRMRSASWAEMQSWNDCDRLPNLRTITVRFEQLHRHVSRFEPAEKMFWIGWAHDDGLTLRSALLPGQVADFMWERV